MINQSLLSGNKVVYPAENGDSRQRIQDAIDECLV